jgi:hypothetical protein
MREESRIDAHLGGQLSPLSRIVPPLKEPPPEILNQGKSSIPRWVDVTLEHQSMVCNRRHGTFDKVLELAETRAAGPVLRGGGGLILSPYAIKGDIDIERGQVFSPPLPAFHPSPMPFCPPSQFGQPKTPLPHGTGSALSRA